MAAIKWTKLSVHKLANGLIVGRVEFAPGTTKRDLVDLEDGPGGIIAEAQDEPCGGLSHSDYRKMENALDDLLEVKQALKSTVAVGDLIDTSDLERSVAMAKEMVQIVREDTEVEI